MRFKEAKARITKWPEQVDLKQSQKAERASRLIAAPARRVVALAVIVISILGNGVALTAAVTSVLPQ